MHLVLAQFAVLLPLLFSASLAYAQGVPGHAQGLKEVLVSVEIANGVQQSGVYSVRVGSESPVKLAVLLPGNPSVVRPVVENDVMTGSRLNGNFLIRARRFLVDDLVATLVVDCRSDSGDVCESAYQASRQREKDVAALVSEVRKRVPGIAEVWLVGTSMGTISSSFMPSFSPGAYAGAIHTAAITDPYAKNSYRELIGFDYGKSGLLQAFVHHVDDPCRLTTFSGAKSITEKFGLPLISVSGGGGFQGAACDAFTEHGFRGKEKEVMKTINAIIRAGKAESMQLN